MAEQLRAGAATANITPPRYMKTIFGEKENPACRIRETD